MRKALTGVEGKIVAGLLHRNRQSVIVLLGAATYLYLILFVPPAIPIDTGAGDDHQFLGEAIRILQGQVIYRDFFEFNFAGTQYLYALLIRLLGARTWLPNACLLLIGGGLLWTSIVISRQLLKGLMALLPGLLFLCLAFRNFLDATHHWYSVLTVMIATAILVKERSNARMTIAGALCGLALCFSQNHGVLAAAGIAAFIYWESHADGAPQSLLLRRELYFLIPVAFIFIAYIIYFSYLGGLSNLLYSTVVFPFKYWGKCDWNGWNLYVGIDIVRQVSSLQFKGLWRSCVIAVLIPGIYLVAAGSCFWGEGAPPGKEWRVVALVTAVGFGLFVSVMNSASLARLSTISLPGFILLIWFIKDAGRTARVFYSFCGILVLILMIRDIWTAQTSYVDVFRTPAGPIALREHYKERYYSWISQHTRPGDYMLDTTNSYFQFGLQNPSRLQFITACGITRPKQVVDVVRDLEKHKVRFVVLDGSWDSGSCPASDNNLAPLREYLHRSYAEVETFRDSSPVTISILEKNK